MDASVWLIGRGVMKGTGRITGPLASMIVIITKKRMINIKISRNRIAITKAINYNKLISI
jgi:hypothetical protein